MVVDVRFPGVPFFFFVALLVVVAVCQDAVIVLLRVPVRPMLPLNHRHAHVAVRKMIVIVRVDLSWMCVFRFGALSFRTLRNLLRHSVTSFPRVSDTDGPWLLVG
jgi:hypothetical protein